MHPFIHPLSTAVDPAWQSRSDWEIYKGFAKKFSELCMGRLGVEREVVLTPLMHDSPAELAQPLDVKEWKRGEDELIPGKTAPQITVVVFSKALIGVAKHRQRNKTMYLILIQRPAPTFPLKPSPR
jgi:nitrate reductase alpha subunit